MKKQRENVLNADIKFLLVSMTLPSVIGMLGIMIFNLTDTFFVAKLGLKSLAAMSFTFPVVFLVSCFSLGLGTGIMSLFSKAVGRHDVQEEIKLATSSLILSVLLASIIAVLGVLTITPLFKCLGAGEDLLPEISSYMKIWYLGSIFVVFPMIGDNILRGLGDTKTPAFVMLTCSVLNLILDPLLIFGVGPFPKMGITGAAVATVIARMLTMFVSLWIIAVRKKLISFKGITFSSLIKEWGGILYISLPNSFVKMIVPVSIGVFTAVLAKFGHTTIAAYGVATKIEGVALTIPHALSITATVFVGQNLGAKKFGRIKLGVFLLFFYAIFSSFLLFFLFFFFGGYLGSFFNDDPKIHFIVGRYLLIVSVGYGFYGVSQIGASIFNVLHKPFFAAFISVFQMCVLNIPLAFLLSSFFQFQGVFVSISVSYVLTGILTFIIISKKVRKIESFG